MGDNTENTGLKTGLNRILGRFGFFPFGKFVTFSVSNMVPATRFELVTP